MAEFEDTQENEEDTNENEDYEENQAVIDILYDTPGEKLLESSTRELFKSEVSQLYKFHPELVSDYASQIAEKLILKGGYPPKNDANHTTYPFVTHLEKTKIISLRASQLSRGATPFVVVPSYMNDFIQIAKLELEQKRIPFILKRTLPDGNSEYWRVSEMIIF